MNLCFQNAEANSKKIQAENQRQKAKIRKLEQTVAEKTKKIEEQVNDLRAQEKNYQEIVKEKNRNEEKSEKLVNQLRHELEVKLASSGSVLKTDIENGIWVFQSCPLVLVYIYVCVCVYSFFRWGKTF